MGGMYKKSKFLDGNKRSCWDPRTDMTRSCAATFLQDFFPPEYTKSTILNILTAFNIYPVSKNKPFKI